MAFATELAAADTRRRYENRAVSFYSFVMMKSSLHREAAGVHGPLQVWVLTIRDTPSGRNARHSRGVQPRRTVRKHSGEKFQTVGYFLLKVYSSACFSSTHTKTRTIQTRSWLLNRVTGRFVKQSIFLIYTIFISYLLIKINLNFFKQ